MCTLIVAVRPDPTRALVVAANRDEDLDRPAEAPAPRRFDGFSVFAPLDLEAGGTWMGLAASGLFVALTNRFGVPRHPGRRSRGAIVVEALARGDAASAAAWSASLDPTHENGFHLVVADRSGAWLTVADGERLLSRALPEGIHVVTERAFGAAPSGRQEALEAHFRSAGSSGLCPTDLAALLAGHEGGPFDGVCVHVPERRYGTRSASIVEVPADPRAPVRWEHAPGPPCRTRFLPLDVRFA